MKRMNRGDRFGCSSGVLETNVTLKELTLDNCDISPEGDGGDREADRHTSCQSRDASRRFRIAKQSRVRHWLRVLGSLRKLARAHTLSDVG